MPPELPYKLIEPILYTSYGWEVNGFKGSLTAEQLTKLNDWLKGVYARVAEKQYTEKTTFGQTRFPYHGAIGGGETFSITGMSLGTVVKVTESISGETINLTDYDSW